MKFNFWGKLIVGFSLLVGLAFTGIALAAALTVPQGGTGRTSFPKGSIITGNNFGALVATTSNPLAIGSLVATTTATSTFTGGITANVLNIISSSATSTFSNGLRILAGSLQLDKLLSCSGGSALGTDSVGKLLCAAITASPGGSDTQVQYNDGGTLAGDADYTWNKTTNALTVSNSTASSSFSGGLTTGGLSSSNGLTITGGNILTSGLITNTNAGTSTFSGAIGTAGLSTSNGLTITGGNLLSSGLFTNTNAGTSTFSGAISTAGLFSSNGLTLTGGNLLSSGLFTNTNTGTSTFTGSLQSSFVTSTGNIRLSSGGYVYGDTNDVHLELSSVNGTHIGFGSGSNHTHITFTGNVIQFNTNNAEKMRLDNGLLGIGTTSPWALLSVNPNGISSVASFAVGSSTKTDLIVRTDGSVGVGTTTPSKNFSVQGNGIFSGDLNVANITATGTPKLAGLTYPTTDGSANQVLQTDGAGTLSFATLSTGAGTISYAAGQALNANDAVAFSTTTQATRNPSMTTDADFGNFGQTTNQKAAQLIDEPSGLLVETMTFKLSKVGSPTDDVVITIVLDSGGLPDESNAIASTTIPNAAITGTAANVNAHFYPAVYVPSNTKLWFVMGRSGADNDTNYFRNQRNTVDTGYLRGYGANKASGTWSSATYDFVFSETDLGITGERIYLASAGFSYATTTTLGYTSASVATSSTATITAFGGLAGFPTLPVGSTIYLSNCLRCIDDVIGKYNVKMGQAIKSDTINVNVSRP